MGQPWEKQWDMAERIFERKEENLTGEEIEIYKNRTRPYNLTTPKEESFKNVYPEEEIKKDLRELERKKKEAGAEKHIHARTQIAESLVAAGVKEHKWFGFGAEVSKTSEFDDFFHGADIILELQTDAGREPLRIAFDITSSAKKENIKDIVYNKLDKIFGRLEKGELGRIKYFESSGSKERKPLKDIPLIVLGFSPEGLNELTKLFYKLDRIPSSAPLSEIRKKRKPINENPIKAEAIEEIIDQLRKQKKYLFKHSHKEKIPIMEKCLSAFQKLELEKKNAQTVKDLGEDEVFKAILEYQPA